MFPLQIRHWIAVFGLILSRDLQATVTDLVKQCRPSPSNRDFSLNNEITPMLSNLLLLCKEIKSAKKYKDTKGLSDAIDLLEELRIVIKKLDKDNVLDLDSELEKYRKLKNKVLNMESKCKDEAKQAVNDMTDKNASRADIVSGANQQSQQAMQGHSCAQSLNGQPPPASSVQRTESPEQFQVMAASVVLFL